jgi:hypothetical protein
MKIFRIFAVGLIIPFALSEKASAGVISEIAPFGGGGQPSYAELTLTQSVTSLELLVLNGSPYRETDIRERVAFGVNPGTSVVVIHEGTWVGGSAFDTQLVGVASLDLGSYGYGAARRLALFDTSGGASVGLTVPPLVQWASTPEMPPLLDVVAYSINGWEVNDSLGEPIFELATNEAALRLRRLAP